MSNQPKYHAFTVRERGNGRKAIWTRIGVVWAHEKSAGLNLELEALPVTFDGRIVLLPPKGRDVSGNTSAAFGSDDETPFDA